MNLRYVALYMDSDSGYKDAFRDEFNLSSRFICNYVSKKVRKLKYETDGSYNTIGVYPSEIVSNCRIVADNALLARVSFDKERYLQTYDVDRYEYFLFLLTEGYKNCYLFNKIPLDQLLDIHDELRAGGYKNEWLYKKKKIEKHNIEILLNCFFTSFNFSLTMTIIDSKEKKKLLSGVVLRTLPDEVYFQDLFKDILSTRNEIIITDYLNRPKFKFNIEHLLTGKFLPEVIDNGLNYIPYESNSFPIT